MMDTSRIEGLLEGFYKGNTSPVEEKELMAFFSGSDIPDHLMKDRALFLDLTTVKSVMLDYPEGKLEALIDRWEASEGLLKVDFEKPLQKVSLEEMVKPPRPKSLHFSWRMVSVAASLVLLLSIGFFVYRPQKNTFADTYKDPKVAYQEMQHVMFLVSSKLNKGIDQVEMASEKVNEAGKILNKNLK
jgi:hypothetical protein